MSSLSDMRNAVYEQQRLNNELNQELAQIISAINRAFDRWDNLCSNMQNTLSNGARLVDQSHQDLLMASEEQKHIDEVYALFKNIEKANKTIRECNNKKIYDFATYSSVRKIVQGILDNLETSFVKDSTITKSIEIKHLQLPDYWLTCALLSIMAWRNNNKKLADTALARACNLDKKETAVFFMAFNLRMNREAAALKWFEYYRSCNIRGDDNRTFLLLFSIINKVTKENCSDAVIHKVNEYIKEIIDNQKNAASYNEEQLVLKISYHLKQFIPDEVLNYPILMKYCTQANVLQQQLMLAKANTNILNYILQTINVSQVDKKDYLNAFIEDVVKKPNSVEKEVEDTITYNELIIKNQGNVQKAKEQFDLYKMHRQNDFDIYNEMIDWLYRNEEDEDVNPMVRANFLTITKDLHKQSVANHVEAYRKNFTTSYDIKIDEYATTANLTDEAGECLKLKEYIDNACSSKLASIKSWFSYIAFGLAVVIAVLSIIFEIYPLLVLSVGAIIFGVIYLLMCNAKKKATIRDYENLYLLRSSVIKDIVNEFNQYVGEYRKYDEYAQRIEEELDKL